MAVYGNWRLYQLDGVDFETKLTDKINVRIEGAEREIDFIEYYKIKYGIDIEYTDQPLLKHIQRSKDVNGNRVNKTILLIPELCKMTGLEDS